MFLSVEMSTLKWNGFYFKLITLEKVCEKKHAITLKREQFNEMEWIQSPKYSIIFKNSNFNRYVSKTSNIYFHLLKIVDSFDVHMMQYILVKPVAKLELLSPNINIIKEWKSI